MGTLRDRCMLGYVPGVTASVWSTYVHNGLFTNGRGAAPPTHPLFFQGLRRASPLSQVLVGTGATGAGGKAACGMPLPPSQSKPRRHTSIQRICVRTAAALRSVILPYWSAIMVRVLLGASTLLTSTIQCLFVLPVSPV